MGHLITSARKLDKRTKARDAGQEGVLYELFERGGYDFRKFGFRTSGNGGYMVIRERRGEIRLITSYGLSRRLAAHLGPPPRSIIPEALDNLAAKA